MKIKKKNHLMPIAALLGIIFGLLFAPIESKLSLISLSGGYLRPFTSAFSFLWLYKALLAEWLPIAVIYFAGFSFIGRPFSALAVFSRSFLSSCTLALLYKQISNDVSIYLYIFICLSDCAVIGILLSLSRLSALFFHSALARFQFRKVKRYTADFLFFTGLLILFYFIKECIIAMLLRLA